ncbi:MAG: protease modulator HflC [Candidatus Lernaella stagnicola]|nr:protease modulator HflC [Candidatus Lernaella stagnicola]
MKRWKKGLLLVLVLLAAWWLRTIFFVVNATETAIIARFMGPLDAVYEPGLHLKAPWPIDTVYRFDSRLLVFDHVPTEFLTKDKKNILIDSFAVWRVADEHTFLAKVRSRMNAEILLLEIMTAAINEVVGNYALGSFINVDPEKVQLKEINGAIADICRGPTENAYGISVEDVRINSFNFPVQNRASVIKRMRAERDRIATKYRSEGEEAALKIEAETNLESRKILAEAARDAQRIRGKGEAEAIRIYGEAYTKDPEFYRFLRTLEAYDKMIDKDTTIILRSDSELWKMIDKGAP